MWKALTIAVSAVVGSASGPFLSLRPLSEVAKDETTLSQLWRDPLLPHQLETHVFFLGGPCPPRHRGSCSSAQAKLISATGRLNFKRICKWPSLWPGILMLTERPDVTSSCLKQKSRTLLLTLKCFYTISVSEQTRWPSCKIRQFEIVLGEIEWIRNTRWVLKTTTTAICSFTQTTVQLPEHIHLFVWTYSAENEWP